MNNHDCHDRHESSWIIMIIMNYHESSWIIRDYHDYYGLLWLSWIGGSRMVPQMAGRAHELIRLMRFPLSAQRWYSNSFHFLPLYFSHHHIHVIWVLRTLSLAILISLGICPQALGRSYKVFGRSARRHIFHRHILLFHLEKASTMVHQPMDLRELYYIYWTTLKYTKVYCSILKYTVVYYSIL